MNLSFKQKAIILITLDKEIKYLSSLSTIVNSDDPQAIRDLASELRELKEVFLEVEK